MSGKVILAKAEQPLNALDGTLVKVDLLKSKFSNALQLEKAAEPIDFKLHLSSPSMFVKD